MQSKHPIILDVPLLQGAPKRRPNAPLIGKHWVSLSLAAQVYYPKQRATCNGSLETARHHYVMHHESIR